MSTITSTIKKLRLFTQNHIRGTVIGDGFINVLKAMGVNDCFTKIIYAQDRKNPTKSMLYAQKYFAEHQKKTAEIASLFADDFSREVYFSVIKYRMSHNPKDVPLFSKHDQYFVKDIVPLTDKEVFIDCGAFDGDTMKDFIKATGGNYQSIVCFEPVEEFHKKLVKRGAGKNITAICAGVYKESTTLQFNAEAGKGSSISAGAANTVSVPVRAIDDVPECKDATFIKMDVEGSELEALKGAKQTILRNKPKLAICLYHKTKDYIEIPNWIHTLVPEYKLYARHHSFSINETVLYAIPPET
ncbi:MAG: FkbM family methyltransferase [Lachnospiraceae bacterium]|nr:FkbM family methyltransferase [Lachnospiraceae bacterium]